MTFRQSLLLVTACSGAIGGLSLVGAWAQTALPGQAKPAAQPSAQRLTGSNSQANVKVQFAQAPNPASAPGGGVDPSANAIGAPDEPIADVVIKKRELLLKQKDVPSGITEIGPREIEAVQSTGSTQSQLQQSAPSVNVYQQGLGQDVPVISVRGVRGSELAQTLDGVPTQDLIYGGSGAYLSNNISAPFTIDQIDGVTVRPGVSPPGVQGFGTVGGTLAYNSKRPADDRHFDVFGTIGSFGTDFYGFTANTGSLKDAGGLKMMLQYNQGESKGYVNNTDARYPHHPSVFLCPRLTAGVRL